MHTFRFLHKETSLIFINENTAGSFTGFSASWSPEQISQVCCVRGKVNVNQDIDPARASSGRLNEVSA